MMEKSEISLANKRIVIKVGSAVLREHDIQQWKDLIT